MKLSKKLIVTGLLFSSVLGSVNVGAISVSAKSETPGTQTPGTQTPAPTTPVHKVTSKKSIQVSVNFVDENTKKTISTVTLKGKEGNKQKVSLPKGYSLSKGSTDEIKFAKGTSKVTINVEKTSVVKDYNTTVATFADQNTPVYNSQGEVIGNRALAADSNWASDKTMELSGVKYYRVATNEWIKAENVYEYSASQSVVETSAGQFKNLFNSKGELATNRGLASGSRWLTDKTATINGEKMYRVATNEWLKASDIK